MYAGIVDGGGDVVTRLLLSSWRWGGNVVVVVVVVMSSLLSLLFVLVLLVLSLWLLLWRGSRRRSSSSSGAWSWWWRERYGTVWTTVAKNWQHVTSHIHIILLLCTHSWVLQHSFYFYFYFEHLNFTWSYLIDMKISWSLDHIFWSYLLILSSDDDPRYVSLYELYIITYMHSTCLWLMSFIDNQHAFYTCCCATCFYLTLDMLWTHALHVFILRTTHGH